jgi:hypothetical protein
MALSLRLSKEVEIPKSLSESDHPRVWLEDLNWPVNSTRKVRDQVYTRCPIISVGGALPIKSRRG